MQIHISTEDGVPIYLQIVNQVKYMVAAGRLSPGEQLPPVRKLAEELLINPNTVARAYRELEAAKVLANRQGSGAYVADGASPWPNGSRHVSSRTASTCCWQKPGTWTYPSKT